MKARISGIISSIGGASAKSAGADAGNLLDVRRDRAAGIDAGGETFARATVFKTHAAELDDGVPFGIQPGCLQIKCNESARGHLSVAGAVNEGDGGGGLGYAAAVEPGDLPQREGLIELGQRGDSVGRHNNGIPPQTG